MAAVAALLQATPEQLLLTVPVDLEHVPEHLVARLRDALQAGAALAVASDDDGLQPLVALYRAELAAAALGAFGHGQRSVRDWQATLAPAQVRFEGFRFGNRNTLRDLPDGADAR